MRESRQESAQTQMKTGKLIGMKYRILIKVRSDGLACYVPLTGPVRHGICILATFMDREKLKYLC